MKIQSKLLFFAYLCLFYFNALDAIASTEEEPVASGGGAAPVVRVGAAAPVEEEAGKPSIEDLRQSFYDGRYEKATKAKKRKTTERLSVVI